MDEIFSGWEITCPRCHCGLGEANVPMGSTRCDQCGARLIWSKVVEPDDDDGMGQRYETRVDLP